MKRINQLPVRKCTGSSSPTVTKSATGKIISKLSGPLTDAYRNLILGGADQTGSIANREIQLAVQATRAGYGARGLAGSGIAQAGEQQAAADTGMKVWQQYVQNLLGLGQLGTNNPTVTPNQPRGIFGLK
jgi:hypothetical protein